VTGNCTGACSGGSGVLPERFVVTGMVAPGCWQLPLRQHPLLHRPAANGTGYSCHSCRPFRHTYSRKCMPAAELLLHVEHALAAGHTECNLQVAQCCHMWGARLQHCDTLLSLLLLLLMVLVEVPRSCGGTSCPATNGALKSSTPCNNNTPCPPRDCVGSWVARNCSGACGGGAGLLLEEYVVTVTAAYNGEGSLWWTRAQTRCGTCARLLDTHK
jgi:hypothetical protein